MQDQYLKDIKQILADSFGVEEENVTEDAYFEDDLNLGEYDMIELISELEEMYSIVFEQGEKDELETVGDLINLIRDKAE